MSHNTSQTFFVPSSNDFKANDEGLLLLQAAAGVEYAFRRLYELHHGGLYHYAVKFVKSPELAEDVVQDTFVKIWERKGELDHVRHFRGFLYTVCRNLILNVFSRANRESAVRQEITYFALSAQSEIDRLDDATRYEDLAETALALLPPQRQQVFRLCRLEGHSYEEAARILGISRSTVSDHLVKASKFLRDYMSSYADISLLIFILPYFFAE